MLHWERGSSQKEQHREGREEGREVFPTTGLSTHPAPHPHRAPSWACSALWTPDFSLHIQMQSCSGQVFPRLTRGGRVGNQVSPFQLQILSSGHGHRRRGREKGDFRSVLFLQMEAFKVCIFLASLIYPEPPGGLGGLKGKMKACDIHHVTVSLAEKQL